MSMNKPHAMPSALSTNVGTTRCTEERPQNFDNRWNKFFSTLAYPLHVSIINVFLYLI